MLPGLLRNDLSPVGLCSCLDGTSLLGHSTPS